MSDLAILGGPNAKRKPFPVWPQYDDKEQQALRDVLESRVWWRTPGTKTLEFEKAFAAFHGARHGIAVTNGTAALEVTMAGLGIVRKYDLVSRANSQASLGSNHGGPGNWRGRRGHTSGLHLRCDCQRRFVCQCASCNGGR